MNLELVRKKGEKENISKRRINKIALETSWLKKGINIKKYF